MAEIVRQRVDGGHRAFAQLARGLRAADGVIHAADDIGAPEDLRVLDAEAGQALPARQIEQEAGDVGGAEIDRQAQRAAAGRGEIDRFRPAQAHAQRPIIVAQDRWQLPGGGEVERGKGKRARDPVGVGTHVRKRCRGEAHVMARDRRIERQRLDLIAGLDIGAHHRRQRALGDIERAIGERRQLAGAQPARPPLARLGVLRADHMAVGVAHLALRQQHGAGSAIAAAAAGADDAQRRCGARNGRWSRPAASSMQRSSCGNASARGGSGAIRRRMSAH